jgi:predicted TIM-barrel fold metal-dependent hydrolase
MDLEFSVYRKRLPGNLVRHLLQRAKNRILFGEDTPHRFGSVDLQRLKFAQMQEPGYLIDVGTGDYYRGDRRITWALARLELGRA